MGKVKQNKRLSAHRTAGDPMGSKLPLADEIESLKLAKSKSNELNQSNSSKKRQADDAEDQVTLFHRVSFLLYIHL
jgi:hypothetical protein